jgi:hypothetical protein
LLADGGVDPEENLELIDEIHELRRPGSVFGADPFAGTGWGVAGFCSVERSFPVRRPLDTPVSLSTWLLGDNPLTGGVGVGDVASTAGNSSDVSRGCFRSECVSAGPVVLSLPGDAVAFVRDR